MESMESHEAGFPHSLEIPSGLPHSHGLDGWIYVLSYPLNSNHRHRKGLVTDVSGPQRNACPGTLNPSDLLEYDPPQFTISKANVLSAISGTSGSNSVNDGTPKLIDNLCRCPGYSQYTEILPNDQHDFALRCPLGRRQSLRVDVQRHFVEACRNSSCTTFTSSRLFLRMLELGAAERMSPDAFLDAQLSCDWLDVIAHHV
jgi:hypothetical protein